MTKQSLSNDTALRLVISGRPVPLKVPQRENFEGSDFEFFTFSLLVMLEFR